MVHGFCICNLTFPVLVPIKQVKYGHASFVVLPILHDFGIIKFPSLFCIPVSGICWLLHHW
jgi:hypothetical protein